MANSFWADSFWSSSFWAPNFWTGNAPTPPPTPSVGLQGGGGGGTSSWERWKDFAPKREQRKYDRLMAALLAAQKRLAELEEQQHTLAREHAMDLFDRIRKLQERIARMLTELHKLEAKIESEGELFMVTLFIS